MDGDKSIPFLASVRLRRQVCSILTCVNWSLTFGGVVNVPAVRVVRPADLVFVSFAPVYLNKNSDQLIKNRF